MRACPVGVEVLGDGADDAIEQGHVFDDRDVAALHFHRQTVDRGIRDFHAFAIGEQITSRHGAHPGQTGRGLGAVYVVELYPASHIQIADDFRVFILFLGLVGDVGPESLDDDFLVMMVQQGACLRARFR